MEQSSFSQTIQAITNIQYNYNLSSIDSIVGAMTVPSIHVWTRRESEEYKNTMYGGGDLSSTRNIINEVLNDSNLSFSKDMHMYSS